MADQGRKRRDTFTPFRLLSGFNRTWQIDTKPDRNNTREATCCFSESHDTTSLTFNLCLIYRLQRTSPACLPKNVHISADKNSFDLEKTHCGFLEFHELLESVFRDLFIWRSTFYWFSSNFRLLYPPLGKISLIMMSTFTIGTLHTQEIASKVNVSKALVNYAEELRMDGWWNQKVKSGLQTCGDARPAGTSAGEVRNLFPSQYRDDDGCGTHRGFFFLRLRPPELKVHLSLMSPLLSLAGPGQMQSDICNCRELVVTHGPKIVANCFN